MLSFKLSDAFVARYTETPVPWGNMDAAGNSVGELVFLRTYSRLKADGTKERWWEVCRRVVEGTMSIQKDHVRKNKLPWNGKKAAATAEEMFDRLFNLKWTPPGRGLWMMGTPLVNEHGNSAALQNCAFVSTSSMTRANPAAPFAFLMEASMLGIGVGFDTLGSDKDFKVFKPQGEKDYYTAWPIPDTREGWVESVVKLLESYLLKGGRQRVDFVYDHIRKAGEPIKTFGGTAAGPEPLQMLHTKLRTLLDGLAYKGALLDSIALMDVANLIGVCVVSGNVRRSAELALGSIADDRFLSAKDYTAFPERNAFSDDPNVNGWGWMSNNSVAVNVGDDLSKVVDGIKRNGEPGIVWLDLSRSHGRLIDPPNNKDHRVMGYNPCAEQSLESYECCTLVETYLNRHDSMEDYQRTLKFAYLYAKTVTLLPTHWEETNAIMQRNRRIGLSMSGIANFADRNGLPELRRWMDNGYHTVQDWDGIYSEWLCVRESIKNTTVKPSGTVSILAGESPGAHWAPGGEFFDRRINFDVNDPAVTLFRWAGYQVEDSVYTPGKTVVVTFPIHSLAKRSEQDVSIFEKVNLAITAQRYWSDNSVSVTISFDPETEGDHIPATLQMAEGNLKTVSYLPMGGVYQQMPYTPITESDYTDATMRLMKIDLTGIYEGLGSEAIGEAYCTTDKCVVDLPTA